MTLKNAKLCLMYVFIHGFANFNLFTIHVYGNFNWVYDESHYFESSTKLLKSSIFHTFTNVLDAIRKFDVSFKKISYFSDFNFF